MSDTRCSKHAALDIGFDGCVPCLASEIATLRAALVRAKTALLGHFICVDPDCDEGACLDGRACLAAIDAALGGEGTVKL